MKEDITQLLSVGKSKRLNNWEGNNHVYNIN